MLPNLLSINFLVPFAAHKFDASKAIRGLRGMPRSVLLIGQASPPAGVDIKKRQRVTSEAEAIGLLGEGSMLLAMWRAAKANADLGMPIDLVILADDATAIAATGKVTIQVDAQHAAGELPLYIGGRRVRVGVAVNDTPATVATKLINAIKATPSLPVSAAAGGADGEVKLTCRWKGETGNSINLRGTYYADDRLPQGVTMRGVLVTTDAEGRVLITRAGKTKSHGAIVRGVNVVSMEGVGTDAERFSDYFCYGQGNVVHHKSLQTLEVGGSIGNVDKTFKKAVQQKAHTKDPEMRRYLPLVINADGNNTAPDMQRLVDHTMRVRRGHAFGLKYVVEGWTWKGKPWEINTRVPIYDDIAGLDGDEWLICEAKQTVDLKEGDVTELLVRPVEAYDTVPLKSKTKHDKRKGKRGKDGAVLEIKGDPS